MVSAHAQLKTCNREGLGPRLIHVYVCIHVFMYNMRGHTCTLYKHTPNNVHVHNVCMYKDVHVHTMYMYVHVHVHEEFPASSLWLKWIMKQLQALNL